jgi:hypothetical protein
VKPAKNSHHNSFAIFVRFVVKIFFEPLTMQESTQQEYEDPLRDHLVCCPQLSLRWRKLSQPLSDAEYFRIHNDNIKLMEVLVSGEDAGDVESAMDKDSMKEIKKLDAKLNLLMVWIGQMMLQQQAVPSPKTVCLSSLGLQFPCDDAKDLRENDNLYLEMFLESRYPQAFITLAKVIQIKPQAEGDEVLVRFADLSEQNQQWLDKYVFQLHRRQVALSRKTDRPLVFK